MVERSPLLSALPDHLQSLLTSTLQTHSLNTWEIKEEGETSEVVYRLVFGKKEEDGIHADGSVEETKQEAVSSSTSTTSTSVQGEERQDTSGSCTTTATRPTSAPATTDRDQQVVARLACLADYEDHCRRTLSQSAWLYFSGGAMTGATVQRNRDAFKNILITTNQLAFDSVSHPDPTCPIWCTRQTVALPIGISPTGFHSWATPKGELATVGAAREAGVVYVSSIHSSTKLEDIAEAEPEAIRWQEHILLKDRSVTEDMVQRAEKAGVTAFVLSIDSITDGLSWDRMRGLTRFPDHLSTANFSDPKLLEYHPKPTWEDVHEFCSMTSLPVILKGIMTPETAKWAVKVQAQGIIVSNHGGRTLDSLPATMEVLRDVAEAVYDDEIELFVDGGIMTGLDVFKALAYGAQMVFIDRPAIWGLAHGGQAGLCHVIDILKEELLNVMKLAGTPTVGDITMGRIYKSQH